MVSGCLNVRAGSKHAVRSLEGLEPGTARRAVWLLEENDPALLTAALGDTARTRGMA